MFDVEVGLGVALFFGWLRVLGCYCFLVFVFVIVSIRGLVAT